MHIEYIDKKPKVSLMRHLNMGDVFIFEPRFIGCPHAFVFLSNSTFQISLPP